MPLAGLRFRMTPRKSMSKRPAVVLLLAGALTFGPTPRSAAAAPGTPGALSAPSVPASGPAPASKPAPALRAAADRVLFGFRELVEPPPQQLSFLDIAELESGAPMRAYVLRSHAAAIDALLALATTPEASARVGKVMRQLDQGRSHEGEVWLEELSRNDAAAARHLAALRELPAALGARMSPSDAGLRFHGGLDRDNRVAGSLAESDYRRAAALDPGDPWTWLVLAWLDDMRAEADLTRCLAAARTAGNVQVQILAQQQLARVAQLQGRQAEARGAWFAAAKLAGDAAGRAGSGIGTREHAQALSALAIHLAANGSTAEARQMLRKVLDMRWQLVREQRNVLPIELELVGSLQRLGRLQREAGLVPPGSTPANDLEQQAWLVYQAMEHLSFTELRAEVDSLAKGRLGVLFHIKGEHKPPTQQQINLSWREVLTRKIERVLPLPSGTKVDLTLDTSLNLDQLLADFADYQGLRGSHPVQPPSPTVTPDPRRHPK